VRADVVVLAAGTLGTTEILLRSREAGLAVSDMLGEHFTGNGDVLGFAYDIDRAVHGIGMPPHPDGRPAPGPCIAGLIDLRTGERSGGLVVEDGAVPSPLRTFMPLGFAVAAGAIGRDNRPLASALARVVREFAGVVRGPFAGPTDRTLMFLVMSGEDGAGRILLDGDRATVHWPRAGDGPPFRHDNDELFTGTAALSGTYLPDPLWIGALGHSVITVHPLGGCVMADDAQDGVVSGRGEVYNSASGPTTYDGLYVTDGSVVPRPLAVNPLLTISALAERTCEGLLQTWGDRWPRPN
jgi:cholesterol oxidase